MKSISITFSAPGITIPINYQYGVHSMLLNVLRNAGPEFEHWHDESMDYGKRQYRLHTFSSLRGTKTVAGKKITFNDLIYLDVRGVREDFCDALISALKKVDFVTLYHQSISIISMKHSQPKIEADNIHIKMLSPLTIHRTDESGKSYYFTPLDLEFSEQINQNFKRKFSAHSGHEVPDGIILKPFQIGQKDKVVTVFKNTIITAWRGEYTLIGNPEHLNFLYYCGLGDRNSNGFGMFEVI